MNNSEHTARQTQHFEPETNAPPEPPEWFMWTVTVIGTAIFIAVCSGVLAGVTSGILRGMSWWLSCS